MCRSGMVVGCCHLPLQVLSRLLPIVIGKLGPGASPAVQKKVRGAALLRRTDGAACS